VTHPLTQAREVLELERANGNPFAAAWPAAVAAAGSGWHGVLAETRSTWQRAYQNVEPSRAERGVAALADFDLVELAEIREHWRPVPAPRRPAPTPARPADPRRRRVAA
jgi:hypothetical protein